MKTTDLIEEGYRFDWFNCSKEFQGKTPADKARIKAIVDRAEWVEIGAGLDLPMMPGLGIEAAIKEHKIPKVKRVSYATHDLAPYGLYGIEGHYKNARVLLFFVDAGTFISTLCVYEMKIQN